MVRGLLTILVVLTATATVAAPRPRRVEPPIDRYCQTTTSSEKLAACITTYARGSTVVQLAPDLQRVRSPEGREYMFLQFGDAWQLVYRPGDENYELVGRSELQVAKEKARRIDLGHHVALGNTGVFIERVSLVCSGKGCTAFTTACTVIQRGRAVETFRGSLAVAPDGTMSLDGDRTYATAMCRGR